MSDGGFSRRMFIANSGGVLAGGWLSAALPLISAAAQTACSRRDQNDGYANLNPLDAADLEAIAEQILPSSDTPGAREAGVIWFIDEALGGFRGKWNDPVREGLGSLNASLTGTARFADLDWERQTEMLQAIETTPFFAMLHFLTIAGMFSLPSYGGNQDKIGWALLNFEDRHAWQPPFGYYDANYTAGQS